MIDIVVKALALEKSRGHSAVLDRMEGDTEVSSFGL